LSILAYFGLVHSLNSWTSEMVSRSLQDFCIGIELFVLAIIHQYVFKYDSYRDPEKAPFLYDHERHKFFSHTRENVGPVVNNFISVAKIKDIVHETKQNFLEPLIEEIVEEEEEIADGEREVEIRVREKISNILGLHRKDINNGDVTGVKDA